MAARVHHVLLADDEPLIVRLVREILTQDGHTVETCEDGAQALQQYDQGSYTLLVLDVMMPRKTGVEVVLQLRDRGDTVPVLLMSSHAPEEVLQACAGVPHLVFLQKPFGVADLRAALVKIDESIRC